MGLLYMVGQLCMFITVQLAVQDQDAGHPESAVHVMHDQLSTQFKRLRMPAGHAGQAETYSVTFQLHALQQAGSACFQALQLAVLAMLLAPQHLQLCGPAHTHNQV